MTAYLLNILDLLFTLHAISHGGTEVNPLMRSVPVMVFYKTVVVGLFCYVLHWCKARKALRLCSAVFTVINLWHIINIF